MTKALSLISMEYDGTPVVFNDDGWFNATQAAARFGKRPVDWLTQDGAGEYIAVLAQQLKCEPASLLKTRRGNAGGTWMHPRLAIPFARWLDVRFGVWCDDQIFKIVAGKHPHHDWRRMRHEAASSFKVMNEVLRLTRDEAGKDVHPHHYINEARLVNFVLTGTFSGLDRNALSADDLDLLARLEARNAVLLAKGLSYEARKTLLGETAADWRIATSEQRSLA